MASRLEVERLLTRSGITTITLRAAVIVGSGSTSFEIIRQISERMLVTTVPDWMNSQVQPIAVTDVLEALLGALAVHFGRGPTTWAAPEERLPYPELLKLYAGVAGLRRPQVAIPALPTDVVGTLAGLLTDVPTSTVEALVESLHHDMVCRENDARAALFRSGHTFVPLKESFVRALARPQMGRAADTDPRTLDPMGPMPHDPQWSGGHGGGIACPHRRSGSRRHRNPGSPHEGVVMTESPAPAPALADADADGIATVHELIKGQRTAMLTTHHADGSIVTRPMACQEAEFDGSLWFFAFSDSQKVAHIRPTRVNVAFTQEGAWVSLTGTAKVVHDEAKARELWNPFAKAWFPCEPEDPQGRAHSGGLHGSRVLGRPGKPAQLISTLKAVVTGSRPDDGGNATVSSDPDSDSDSAPPGGQLPDPDPASEAIPPAATTPVRWSRLRPSMTNSCAGSSATNAIPTARGSAGASSLPSPCSSARSGWPPASGWTVTRPTSRLRRSPWPQ